MPSKEEITNWFMSLQDDICKALEKEDGKGKFIEDNWIREEGGGGRDRDRERERREKDRERERERAERERFTRSRSRSERDRDRERDFDMRDAR